MACLFVGKGFVYMRGWRGGSVSRVLAAQVEDLSSIPSTLIKKPGVARHACDPSPGESEADGSPGLTGENT